MAGTITVSCGNQKATYQVNLSKGNLQKAFSFYDSKTTKTQQKLFNFSQSEFKTQDQNLFNKICTALNKLKALAGDKNVIDDADFSKAPVNSAECKDNIWHCDNCEDITSMDYHTDNQTKFFHIN